MWKPVRKYNSGAEKNNPVSVTLPYTVEILCVSFRYVYHKILFGTYIPRPPRKEAKAPRVLRAGAGVPPENMVSLNRGYNQFQPHMYFLSAAAAAPAAAPASCLGSGRRGGAAGPNCQVHAGRDGGRGGGGNAWRRQDWLDQGKKNAKHKYIWPHFASIRSLNNVMRSGEARQGGRLASVPTCVAAGPGRSQRQ